MPLRGIPGGVAFAMPPAPLLVGLGAAAALALGLHRRAFDRWRPLLVVLCGVPLLVSLPAAWGSSPAELHSAIARAAADGTTHLWASLTVAALLAALAVGLVGHRIIDWRATPERASLRPARALVAALLGSAFVLLILRTSTGVDFLSSWARWGAIGVAMAASVLVALTPGENDGTEPAVHALLFACVGVSLLAQREYVAALAAGTLAHVDPFLDPAPYEHSLREIAWAVEPRERYGWLLGLLPSVVLGGWLRAPRRAALPAALALGLLGMGLGVSRQLDLRAARIAGDAGSSATEPAGALFQWSRRAIPRSVPWLEAMQSTEPVRCAVWTSPE